MGAESSFTDAEDWSGTSGEGSIKTTCKVASSRASLSFSQLPLCEAKQCRHVSLVPLGCVETDGARPCTDLAFVLDENGGAQVWCRINATPVSQSCHSWVHSEDLHAKLCFGGQM